MARYPPDTRMQNFWKEAIERESKARLLTFAKLRGQTHCKSRQLEVHRKKIEDNKPSDALLERLPSIPAEVRHGKKKADFNAVDGMERSKTDSWFDAPQMRPVSPVVRRTLYSGITKEGKGRHIYLKQRYDKIPEEKFSFPTCSSWDYGWRLNDVIKKEEVKKPTYGRHKIIEDTFYSRNGLYSSCSRVH